jgi:hypothetical protein
MKLVDAKAVLYLYFLNSLTAPSQASSSSSTRDSFLSLSYSLLTSPSASVNSSLDSSTVDPAPATPSSESSANRAVPQQNSDDDAPLVSLRNTLAAAINHDSDEDTNMDTDQDLKQLLNFNEKGGKRKGLLNQTIKFSTVRLMLPNSDDWFSLECNQL